MGDEKMVLSHDPVPGYRRVFCIVVLVASIYLCFIFVQSLL